MMARRGWRERILLWTAPALLLFVLAVALAPSLLAPWLSARLSAWGGVPMRVGWISWNPLAAGVTLHDLTVAPAPGVPPIVTVDAVRAEVALGRLLSGELALTRLLLKRPWIALRRTADGDFDVAALLRTMPAAAEGAAASAAERALRVRRFRVVGGSIDFRDETTTPALETSLHIEDATADDVALAVTGRAALTLHLESRLDREPLTLDVAYHTAGGDSTLQARLVTHGATLARTLVYVPLGWRRVAGTLDVEATYTREVVGGRLRVHRLRAAGTLHEIALGEPWFPEPTLRARRVRLGAVAVDLVRRQSDLGTITVDDFTALVARDEGGVHLPLADTAAAAPATGWRTTLAGVVLGSGEVVLREIVPGAEPELRARVRRGRVAYDDEGVSLDLDARVAGGSAALEGATRGSLTRLRLTLDALALPEVAERLRLPLRFATGQVGGAVVMHFGDGPPRLSGSLHLQGGKTIAPDPDHPADVIAWQDLVLEITAATFEPLHVHLARLSTDWPYLMIERQPRGIFPATLADRGAPPAPTPATSAGEARPMLEIDAGTFHGGRVEFYDTTLATPYWTELAETELAFRGLRLFPPSLERFELTAALDEISPLEARGTIAAPSTQVRTRIAQLRLPPLNPYLEPVLGYTITSGTARVDADVSVRGAELLAENDVVLSRFAMSATGEDALQSQLGGPLSVVLALMKDSRGDIRLTLPLHGDLAAQEYRVGRVFLTALRESLIGALRAPLMFLGAVFRREEHERFDLRPVPFAPGSAAIDAAASERIAQVARLLARQAGLRAVLIADLGAADVERLREAAILARLEAASPAERGPADAVVRELLRARRAGASPAPLAPEAAAALAAWEATVPVAPEELRGLAEARVEAVARELTETHRVSPSRVEHGPGGAAAPGPETAPGVDLQLRGD